MIGVLCCHSQRRGGSRVLDAERSSLCGAFNAIYFLEGAVDDKQCHLLYADGVVSDNSPAHVGVPHKPFLVLRPQDIYKESADRDALSQKGERNSLLVVCSSGSPPHTPRSPHSPAGGIRSGGAVHVPFAESLSAFAPVGGASHNELPPASASHPTDSAADDWAAGRDRRKSHSVSPSPRGSARPRARVSHPHPHSRSVSRPTHGGGGNAVPSCAPASSASASASASSASVRRSSCHRKSHLSQLSATTAGSSRPRNSLSVGASSADCGALTAATLATETAAKPTAARKSVLADGTRVEVHLTRALKDEVRKVGGAKLCLHFLSAGGPVQVRACVLVVCTTSLVGLLCKPSHGRRAE